MERGCGSNSRWERHPDLNWGSCPGLTDGEGCERQHVDRNCGNHDGREVAVEVKKERRDSEMLALLPGHKGRFHC